MWSKVWKSYREMYVCVCGVGVARYLEEERREKESGREREIG